MVVRRAAVRYLPVMALKVLLWRTLVKADGIGVELKPRTKLCRISAGMRRDLASCATSLRGRDGQCSLFRERPSCAPEDVNRGLARPPHRARRPKFQAVMQAVRRKTASLCTTDQAVALRLLRKLVSRVPVASKRWKRTHEGVVAVEQKQDAPGRPPRLRRRSSHPSSVHAAPSASSARRK